MGTYVGYIEKKTYDEGAIFYNFRPIAEKKDFRLIDLNDSDLERLLPESERRTINFVFSWKDNKEREEMEKMFVDKSLVIFDFTTNVLQDNYLNNGERNPTGYKVQAIEMIKKGKIRNIDTAGIYYTISNKDLISNFTNDAVVTIDTQYINKGNKVFVDFEDYWVGPYEVGYQASDSSYYIRPEIKDNKYTVSGYKKDDVIIRQISIADIYKNKFENSCDVLIIKNNAKLEQIDVISDKILLESFSDSVINSGITERNIKLDNINLLIDRYKESIFSGSILTQKIQNDRLTRLLNILTSEKNVDSTLKEITNIICDLLIKYQNSPNVNNWLKSIITKNPNLIEQMKESKAISERIEQMNQNLIELKGENERLEEEIRKKRDEANEINKAAIEAKTAELLEKEARYNELCENINTAKQTYGLIEDIVKLQKQKGDLENDVNYYKRHRDNLNSESRGLEIKFNQLINDSYEKMFNIAFDGFIANEMLSAAAKWEAEKANVEHDNLMLKINSVLCKDKTREELIEYLCKNIQIKRPTYSRNTILNIAICFTQSFLTVFSGEPGCGKTSICNIFAEVLGLNKISDSVDCGQEEKEYVKRYVPVSVERGWTSKRDFVGYYNPLSKKFDRSNRRVYDALHFLNTEKCREMSKFPYLILLDEANLSPMEYYWSDFMNICDDLGSQSKINLGEDYVYTIPETLHFFATINNDHTTETLSPRLIDRAWIISLPKQNNISFKNIDIPNENIELVSWRSLSNAFAPDKAEYVFNSEVQKNYNSIILKLKEKRFTVSPRVERAIKRYWDVASITFEADETKTEPEIVALDYAVAQRILPKIIGSGEEFEKWLEDLKSLCNNHGLNMCVRILKDIIERGNQQMKYYQFFY